MIGSKEVEGRRSKSKIDEGSKYGGKLMLHSLSSTWRESEGQTSGNNENFENKF